MFKLNRTDKHPPEKWFAYPESPDEEYLLRYLNLESLSTIADAKLIDRVLVDWKGVLGENGEHVQCTPEARAEFLRDESGEAAKRIFWMSATACRIDNFVDLESLLKNSARLLDGKQSTTRQPSTAVN